MINRNDILNVTFIFEVLSMCQETDELRDIIFNSWGVLEILNRLKRNFFFRRNQTDLKITKFS